MRKANARTVERMLRVNDRTAETMSKGNARNGAITEVGKAEAIKVVVDREVEVASKFR